MNEGVFFGNLFYRIWQFFIGILAFYIGSTYQKPKSAIKNDLKNGVLKTTGNTQLNGYIGNKMTKIPKISHNCYKRKHSKKVKIFKF